MMARWLERQSGREEGASPPTPAGSHSVAMETLQEAPLKGPLMVFSGVTLMGVGGGKPGKFLHPGTHSGAVGEACHHPQSREHGSGEPSDPRGHGAAPLHLPRALLPAGLGPGRPRGANLRTCDARTCALRGKHVSRGVDRAPQMIPAATMTHNVPSGHDTPLPHLSEGEPPVPTHEAGGLGLCRG